MPTIKSIIEVFLKTNRCNYNNIEKVLLGNEKYSLILQEEMIKIINKNIIKTTNKDLLNIDIASAINESMNKIKPFKLKVESKEVYNLLVEFLNKKYGFKIDISEVNEKIIGSAEERCLYLLRQTEREYMNGERKTLTDIAGELGCSTRVLQKDIKQMTQQGFKLMGMNIKIIEDDQSLLRMESTPHPVILMQNITQLIVILEGLRRIEKITAFTNYARSSAIDVWNQLTEYARGKILDAIEKLNDDSDVLNWYDKIDQEGKWHNRFLSEFESCGKDPVSQLMYIMKSEQSFNLTYADSEDKEITLFDCKIVTYLIDEHKLTLKTPRGKYEILDENIIEIAIV